jgi:MFS transporter
MPPGLRGVFWPVWLGCAVSFLADGLLTGYLPLLAASGTNDARLVSLVSAVFSFGSLATGLVAGAVADRCDRLGLMRESNLLRVAVLVVFLVLLLAGRSSFAALLVVSGLLGALEPYFDAASSAVIPEIVEPRAYEKANVLMQISLLAAGSLLGPSLGGVLFSAAPKLPIGLTAITFTVSAFVILGVEKRRYRAITAPSPQTSIVQDLVQGIGYLWRDVVLRTLAGCAAVVNGAVAGVLAVLVLFVTENLGLRPGHYGLVVACFAVGGAAAASAAPVLGRHVAPRVLILASMAVLATSGLILGMAVTPVVACLMLGLAGGAVIVWNVVVVTYRQRTVPLSLLGRVTSAYRVVGKASMVLGALTAGQLARGVGIPTTFVIGGITVLATALVAARSLGHMLPAAGADMLTGDEDTRHSKHPGGDIP